jgi:hypothetical protein
VKPVLELELGWLPLGLPRSPQELLAQQLFENCFVEKQLWGQWL